MFPTQLRGLSRALTPWRFATALFSGVSALALVIATAPAFADSGGAGSAGNGGAGGAGSATSTGTAGTSGAGAGASFGGGGGGAGTTGGAGGTGGGGAAGGAGGVGQAGAGGGGATGGTDQGGGGGGGGSHFAVITTTTTNSSAATGGTGGAGGLAGLSTASAVGGGGGGEGGYGYVINSPVSLSNTSSITGGTGGGGGNGNAGRGGVGGDGGFGVVTTTFPGATLNNAAADTITGGTGGAGGAGASNSFKGGNGGKGAAGVNDAADGLTINDSGIITGGNGGAGGGAGGNGGAGGDGVDLNGSVLHVTGGTIIAGSGGAAGAAGGGAAAGTAGANGFAIDVKGSANSGLTLSGAFTITGGIKIESGSTLTYTDGGGGPATLSNVISGAGALAVNSGTLVLDGVSTFTGGVSLGGGTLFVGDAATPTASIASGVTVGLLSTLSGYGTISGNVANTAGTVFAGGTNGTIGTLTITGTYTQSAGATLKVEVSPTTASFLNVGGTASLAIASTVNVVYDPGTYTSKTYDLVHATGVFNLPGTLTGTLPTGVSAARLTNTGNDLNLILTAGGGGGLAVTTPTGVLGDASPLGLSQFYDSDNQVFDHLDEVGQSSDTIKTSFAAHAPMQLAMNGSLDQVAQLGDQMPNLLAQYGGWVRGIGDFESARGQGAVPGFSSSGGGFLAGIDHAFGPLRFGVAGGYNGTNLKQKDGETGDIQTPRLMVYGRYTATPQIIVDGIAGFALDRIHTSRPITALGTNAVETHEGTEGNFALEAGYIVPWQGFTLIPRLGAQYVHLTQQGYTENGASGFNMTAPHSHLDSFQPLVSIAALKTYTLDNGTVLTPEMKLAFAHELLNTSQTLAMTTPSGSVITGTILTPAHNTITIGPEVTAQMTQALSLYADYKAVIGLGKSLDNVTFGGARWDW